MLISGCKDTAVRYTNRDTTVYKRKPSSYHTVWFSGIDQAAEDAVKKYLSCQNATPEPYSQPLQMTPLPECPWQNLAADFCGPLPSREYLLVMIDDYSRYPVVEIVTTTSANAVIPAFDRVLYVWHSSDSKER